MSKYLLLLTVFLTASFCYGDTNLLTNPGFESGTTGWSGFGCSFTTSGTNYRNGSSSGYAYSRGGTWNGIRQSLLDKMVPGETYQISGWMKIEGAADCNINVTIVKTDGSGTNYTWVAWGKGYDSNWTQLKGSYTLDVNGTLTELAIYFEGPPAGINYYLDDVNVFGPAPGSVAKANINTSVRYQVLEGFGAAGGWYEGWLTAHPLKNTLYDILFGQLGLDIYRIRNTYKIDSPYMDNSAQIITEARALTGRPLQIMLSSWSPSADLKTDGNTVGGTLAKDFNDPNNGAYGYVYQRFAQWWFDSLNSWSSKGVVPEYLNMQNEPYWLAGWDTCKFIPTEDSSWAGYKQAFEAFYTKLNTMPNRPKLLAPESAGISEVGSYINALTATDKSNIYGYAHHLYDGDGSAPDSYISAMTNLANNYGYKPLLQTEFSAGESSFTDAMNLAKLIHNSLTVEGVAVYMYWSLYWGGSGGLVTLPSYGTSDYTINPVYWAFKHYSAFTDPNWQRIYAAANSTSLRISAFISPDNNQMSAIIINTSADTDISLDFNSLGNFHVIDGDVYQTSSTENCVLVGAFDKKSPVLLPANSITTVALRGYSTCAQLQNANLGLAADLNGDCYVDSKDLDIFADNWLNTNCGSLNNCQGADFTPINGIVDFADFSNFAGQWMQCNNPQDANCIFN